MNETIATLFINGEWRRTDRVFMVDDPATSEPFAAASDAASDDVRAAIAAAYDAFPEWSQTTPQKRADILLEIARRMRANKETLATILTRENGKPLAESRAEIDFGIGFFIWFAEEAKRARGEIVPSNAPGKRRLVIRQPLGVIAAITPWNLPVAILARKVAPILAAGCTAVVKPAEQTPCTAIEMFKIFAAAGLPAGVANLITVADPSPVGKEFVANSRVAKITFTGSTAVGRELAAGAGRQLKRVSLELGGHAPFIVFADADVDHAVRQLVVSKFRNSGQTCLCANRIFVHEEILDSFCRKLVAAVQDLRVGGGLSPETDIGPMIDRDGFDKVRRHVEDAIQAGAECLAGGRPVEVPGWERGLFYAPTVLKCATEDLVVCREETFGPVAPILGFTEEEAVVRAANDSVYGLSGYVFTRDLGRAVRVAEALECGVIGVNDGLTPVPECPFGGFKQSGIGREGGWQGLDECLETKYITVAY
ncbi:MAG: NAD-dependent succinate-semialdehyde dehydrogenase [Candidatus Lernaella stagnicola]|nr:NAD-dependent succinate-semialdehyde dehydrogenase [Candidatus Lernaella stagnicola]